MKTIGLLGGMSWESSVEYYRMINQAVQARLGGFHSARCLLYSVDFAEIEALQMADDWAQAGVVLADAARCLERGGAECLVLCTNTMHKVAEVIQAAIDIALLHIADPTAAAIRAHGLEEVGLLGTRFTMKEAFYKARLEDKHGLRVRVPNAEGQASVNRIIYEELVLGQINPAARAHTLQVMDSLAATGAQGVILGCTELGLLIKPDDTPLPVFDTTALHAAAAVEWALS
ncbi:MAG: aspartate/glutamate racemase family protein [Anaerolineae bacterium]|nr:aspartate/glutamate racemase family protein [Anaerolineae bacterium]